MKPTAHAALAALAMMAAPAFAAPTSSAGQPAAAATTSHSAAPKRHRHPAAQPHRTANRSATRH